MSHCFWFLLLYLWTRWATADRRRHRFVEDLRAIPSQRCVAHCADGNAGWAALGLYLPWSGATRFRTGPCDLRSHCITVQLRSWRGQAIDTSTSPTPRLWVDVVINGRPCSPQRSLWIRVPTTPTGARDFPPSIPHLHGHRFQANRPFTRSSPRSSAPHHKRRCLDINLCDRISRLSPPCKKSPVLAFAMSTRGIEMKVRRRNFAKEIIE